MKKILLSILFSVAFSQAQQKMLSLPLEKAKKLGKYSTIIGHMIDDFGLTNKLEGTVFIPHVSATSLNLIEKMLPPYTEQHTKESLFPKNITLKRLTKLSNDINYLDIPELAWVQKRIVKIFLPIVLGENFSKVTSKNIYKTSAEWQNHILDDVSNEHLIPLIVQKQQKPRQNLGIITLGFNHKGELIVGEKSGLIDIHNPLNLKMVNYVSLTNADLWQEQCSISTDKKHLLYLWYRNFKKAHVHIYDMEDEKQKDLKLTTPAQIKKCEINHKGTLFAIEYENGSKTIYDAKSCMPIKHVNYSNHTLASTFHSNGYELIMLKKKLENEQANLYLETHNIKHNVIKHVNLPPAYALTFSNSQDIISHLKPSPNGNLLAIGFNDGTVTLYDLKKSKHIFSLKIQDYIKAGNYFKCLTFSPDSKLLATVIDKPNPDTNHRPISGSIEIWDIKKKECIKRINTDEPQEGFGKFFSSVALHPDPPLLAYTDYEREYNDNFGEPPFNWMVHVQALKKPLYWKKTLAKKMRPVKKTRSICDNISRCTIS